MKITELTTTQRQKVADNLGLGSDAVLRHIQTGRRKASAEMAVRIEKAAKKVGVDVPRESLCETCRRCDLAKAARKNGA